MESNQYCSSLASLVVRIDLDDCCVTIGVCGCVTFRSVHIVIANANASHMHGGSDVGKSVILGHGASSLAIFKGV